MPRAYSDSGNHPQVISLKAGVPVTVVLEIKPGSELNPKAPNHIVLYEESSTQGQLQVQRFDGKAVSKAAPIVLKALRTNTAYRLQVALYSCESTSLGGKGSCHVVKRDLRIHTEAMNDKDTTLRTIHLKIE